QAIVLPLRPAELDRHVLSIDVASFAQALAKRARYANEVGEPPLRNPITGIAGCRPHARFTLTASSRQPAPTRAMNRRRFMSSMGTSTRCAISPADWPVPSLPQFQPAGGRPASPWGRAELF